jgi:hypothetical protein
MTAMERGKEEDLVRVEEVLDVRVRSLRASAGRESELLFSDIVQD